MNRSALLGVILLIAGTACGRNPPPSAVTPAPTTPPRLKRDRNFVPVYPAPLLQVGVGGSVVARLAVTESGRIDVVDSRTESATSSLLATSLPLSLATLHVTPARSGRHPIPGTMLVRFSFATASCDTAGGGRHLTWSPDSTPATIGIVYCRRPILAGAYPNAQRVAHATLSGLYSVSPDWESPSGFIICAASEVHGSLPQVRGRGVGIDVRKVRDWRLVDSLLGGRHPGDRYFVRWEGDVYGPPKTEHLGMDRYVFHPTRIVEAANWADRPCLRR